MSRYLILSRQPLLSGFAGGLLLALAACSGPQPETTKPAASGAVEAKAAAPSDAASVAQPVVRREASAVLQESNAAPAELAKQKAPDSEFAVDGTVSPQRPMLAVAPAPLADAANAGYQDAGREVYQDLPANPVHAVSETPVSTFSIDVDTGSYANVRRFLNDGQLPPPEAVRLEELVNYFPYSYPQPTGDTPFGVGTELAVSPWNPQARLLRVAIKAADLSAAELPPANLVFLVDVS
ncbi:MAG: von Willebrand factor type A domain-containing protein, partial [Pseudomonas sp.]|uniref:von Willebrand factor type A domain-containing protein n=1 Tax=Pseudomonas sp. TaxID=306 RepID=UPI0033932057